MRVITKYEQIIHTLGFTLLLNACHLDKIEPEYPDLVALPIETDHIPLDYCNISNGNLTVRVYNRGSTTAGTSTTSVEFYTRLSSGEFLHLETISKPTSELNSEQVINLLFKIPSECFDPDCEFSINVDVQDNVSETDENNNTRIVDCE